MRAQEREDMIWEVLKDTARKVAPKIPIEVLKKAYEIQIRHQFSQSHNESLRLMEKLIEDYVGGRE